MENMLHQLLSLMALMGLFVFVALYFVNAGYGKFRSSKWGWSISNKIGWTLMEAPALLPVIYFLSICEPNGLQLFFVALYTAHYIYRSTIFPALLKGNSRMPLTIISMGALFNLVNSSLLCAFILQYPKAGYADGMVYMQQWNFLPGLLLFFCGAYTHIKADHTIRHLRKPGDTNHYLPQGGLFNYVTSANYLGELMEWTGFALMLGNAAGWMFVWWTAANLVPRSHAIHKKYREEFGDQAVGNRKRIIPFVY